MNQKFTKRRAARFFAVQALYQREHSEDQPLQAMIGEFVRLRFNDPDHTVAVKGDEELFDKLVQGVQTHQESIDKKIQNMLEGGWGLDRLDAVIRAILRASAYEILYTPETPLPVIINEYLEVSKTFFAQGEVNFIHVALDKIGLLTRGKN